eukprot:2327188-Pyramimonas_sp.AAC.1
MAMRVPPAVISFGVNIGGRHADGATCIVFLLCTKLEGERQLNSGTALIDCRVHAGERSDQTLARFEIARYEAEAAGLNLSLIHI